MQTPWQTGSRRRREIDALARRRAAPSLQFRESLLPLGKGAGLVWAEVGFPEVACGVCVVSSEHYPPTLRLSDHIGIVEVPWRCVWGYGHSCWRSTFKVSRGNGLEP